MGTELRDLTLHLVDLGILREHLTLFYSYLSQDEIAKAKKFRQLYLEENYVLTRGLLRTFLGHYLPTNPQQLTFKYNDRGKPFLAGNPIQFNLSHSGHWSLFCFAPDMAIGVDLELMKPMDDVLSLADRFFCEQETKLLSNLKNRDMQEQAFFTLWTAKEAYLKAIGTGLVGGLDSIEFKLDSQLQIDHWQQTEGTSKADSWSIHRLDLPPSLIGAIAVNQKDCPIPVAPLLTNQALQQVLYSSG